MVARCVRDAEVVGSNPASPTKSEQVSRDACPGCSRCSAKTRRQAVQRADRAACGRTRVTARSNGDVTTTLLTSRTLLITISPTRQPDKVVDHERRTVGYSRYHAYSLELLDATKSPVMSVQCGATSFNRSSLVVAGRESRRVGTIEPGIRLIAAEHGVLGSGDLRPFHAQHAAMIRDTDGDHVAHVQRVARRFPRTLSRAARGLVSAFFFTQVWRIDFMKDPASEDLRLLTLAVPMHLLVDGLGSG